MGSLGGARGQELKVGWWAMIRAGDKRLVGIVTLPGRFNYGNRLQNFAVARIWGSLGYRQESLVLRDRPNLVRSAKRFVKQLLGMLEPCPESLMSLGRLAAFDRFNENTPTRDLGLLDQTLAESYEFFCVGSDQVWNLKMITYSDDWYFLEFARPEQRIALAPSVGLDSLDSKQAKRLARGVSGFPRLSVRERRGAELIKECSGRDAEVICDPTLVLTPQEWRDVADDRCTPSEPYVFTYLLGGAGVEARDVLDRVTDGGRIPVIPLSDRQKPDEPDAGPAEFIDLIDHAQHVVTDSFHAAVFSSILQTPLTITHREGGASMFSRLEQLADMLGIEHKIYGRPEYDLSRAGDYEGVPEAIDRECEKFMAYLKGCLNG